MFVDGRGTRQSGLRRRQGTALVVGRNQRNEYPDFLEMTSRLRRDFFQLVWELTDRILVMIPERPAGCSKRPDFSPAQPWRLLHPPALSLPRQPLRPRTRLIPSKAAASEQARRTLRYVEPLSAARTPLVDFFSILLGNPVGEKNIELSRRLGLAIRYPD